jgi:hypothetical protein
LELKAREPELKPQEQEKSEKTDSRHNYKIGLTGLSDLLDMKDEEQFKGQWNNSYAI